MKKYISFIVLTITFQFSFAQIFEYHSDAPFNIEIINSQEVNNLTLLYLFEDADQDGDVDLTLMGLAEQDTTSISLLHNLRYFLEYQENNGNTTSPMFAAREKSYDNFQFPTGGGFMIPDGGDLNNDGLIDFVVSAEIDIYNIQYLQFQIQNPDGTFTVTNCEDWNLDTFNPYSFYVPKLTDLDMDGDLDLLLSGYYSIYDENLERIEIPSVLYAKNIGTPDTPNFVGWYSNPYGLSSDENSILTSGDLDLDGDMDIIYNGIIDDSVAVFYYRENIGTTKPEFADPIMSPFGLPVGNGSESFLFTSLVDIDGDGDLDFFLPVTVINDGTFELRYYENTAMVADADGDGSPASQDCDDNNPLVFPGQIETIYNGVDDDCDPLTLDDDLDQDGFVLADDCDDNNADINTDQVEVPYNGIDEDCDPLTLDDDLDQDGFVLADDCDDNNADINTDQVEVPYNGIDEDCDPLTLDDDLDQDGFVLADDCDDNNADINTDQVEVPYNGIDEDCDPLTLDDDLDQDGFVLADDCDDNNADINTDQVEVPYNGIDEDCDPLTLDDDLDQDGFVLADDCDDENNNINPDAEEIPNNDIDEDCDGMDLVTSTQEIANSEINIYPNPATDNINIDVLGNLKYETYLYDLDGKLIIKASNNTTIQIQALPQGMYLLEIKDIHSNQRIVEKIIKGN